MDTLELSDEVKSKCSNDRFCNFVEQHEHFTREEIGHLRHTIINKQLSRILYISTILAIWSMVAGWVDAVILPMLIIYAIALPGAEWYPLLFPIAWTILNAFFKFIFIYQRLCDAVSLKDSLLAVVPYIGAAFLLKNWFVGDPLLRKASLAYISHQKKRATQKALSFIKKPV